MNEEPARENRASIWSVPRDWQVWYLALFNIQTICLLGLVSWHEVVTARPADELLDIVIAIGTSMGGLIILVAAESIFLTDVTKMLFTMISDRYLRRQRAMGVAEGRAEGLTEGRAEGLTEGRAEGLTEGRTEERQRWVEWNERRLAAEAAGEIFDEPAPPPNNSNGIG